MFDRQYMGALFHLGQTLASDGYPWKKIPPAPYPQPTGPDVEAQETYREKILAKELTDELNEEQEK